MGDRPCPCCGRIEPDRLKEFQSIYVLWVLPTGDTIVLPKGSSMAPINGASRAEFQVRTLGSQVLSVTIERELR